MVTDPWHGLAVYRSQDAENWRHQGVILGAASKRQDDGPRGHHADVLVLGDEAYIFYHTHPGAKGIQQGPDLEYGRRRSSLHCARLELTDGKVCCLREGLELALDHEMAAAF